MQEPRLACHAAPAQPQCNALGDDVSLGDMHALLRGPGVQHQVPEQPTRLYMFVSNSLALFSLHLVGLALA